jgi:hypothetical protein
MQSVATVELSRNLLSRDFWRRSNFDFCNNIGTFPTCRGGLTMSGRVPLLDIGTLARIRDGSIKVRGGIDHFTPDGVPFSDQVAQKFDAVILATGFRPDLRELLPNLNGVLIREGKPLLTGQATSEPASIFAASSHRRRDNSARLVWRPSELVTSPDIT